MIKIKRVLNLGMAALLSMSMISACGMKTENKAENMQSSQAVEESMEDTKKYSIVTTIFPEYDWVKQVLGDKADNFDITMLLDNGIDLHSYQPSADDIIKLSSADLFIYIGGESDTWVNDALKEKTNENMKVINLLEVLGDNAKEEELVEGMQDDEHDHDHEHADHDHEKEEHMDADHDHEKEEHMDADHDHEKEEHMDADHDHEKEEHADHDHDHEHAEGEHVYDEHIWLSLKNAKIFVNEIEKAISELDKENMEAYKANAEKYISEIDALDKEYEEAVANGSKKTLLFGDRFPFRYLTEDYDLDYYAAFIGCSAETEASFDTVVFLANKLDELGLNSVLTIETSDKKIAKTVIENTKNKNYEIEELNSLQAVKKQDVEAGANYLNIMKDNLEVLKRVLN